MVGLVGIVLATLVRPEAPTVGSDCEVLSTGLLREPIAAISSLAIVVAGWVVRHHRVVPGSALLLAGAASFAAHASAHPTARALDGILAAIALTVVAWSILSDRPDRRHLAMGVGLGAIGLGVWFLTRSHAPLCDAVGPWGHAMWHLVVAAATILTFIPSQATIDG